MKCKKYVGLLGLLLLIVMSLSACVSEAGKVEEEEKDLTELYEDTYRFQADLTHNGNPEMIIMSVHKVLKNPQEAAVVAVENQKDEIMWMKETFLSNSEENPGQDLYFLCSVEGKSCLIYYRPYISEGRATYQYKVFYLNHDGSEEVIAENSVSFDVEADGEAIDFPVEDMIAFAEEVNTYMDKAYVLISTVEGELSYTTDDTMESYKESYQLVTGDEDINSEEELRESLNEYKNKIEVKN